MGKKSWTPEEILSRIRSLNESGCDLASGNVRRLAPKLVAAATRYFGSWRRAVEEIGVDYSSVIGSAQQRAGESRSKWSNELITERIRELVRKKEPLQGAVASLKYSDLYRAACSPRYFGGWTKALKAAGVPVRRCAPGERTRLRTTLSRWKTDLLLERISQISGTGPTLDEHVLRRLAPSLHEATLRRFGSWDKAVRAIQNAGEV